MIAFGEKKSDEEIKLKTFRFKWNFLLRCQRADLLPLMLNFFMRKDRFYFHLVEREGCEGSSCYQMFILCYLSQLSWVRRQLSGCRGSLKNLKSKINFSHRIPRKAYRWSWRNSDNDCSPAHDFSVTPFKFSISLSFNRTTLVQYASCSRTLDSRFVSMLSCNDSFRQELQRRSSQRAHPLTSSPTDHPESPLSPPLLPLTALKWWRQ